MPISIKFEKYKSVASKPEYTVSRAGMGLMIFVEIKNPQRIKVVSSGKGKPIPPRIRRIKSPRYGKCSKMGEKFNRNIKLKVHQGIEK
jgi:hypothetical protein